MTDEAERQLLESDPVYLDLIRQRDEAYDQLERLRERQAFVARLMQRSKMGSETKSMHPLIDRWIELLGG